MLAMSCCKSNGQTIHYKVVYADPDLYFPSYPEPNNNVLPYDKDFHKVTDDDTEIEYVLMPYWYYILIMKYKLQVQEAEIKYKSFQEKLK